MKVKDYLETEKITEEMVINVADESDYWQSGSDFLINNWDRDLENLSPKQKSWLVKMTDDLAEKRINGEL